MSKFSDHIPIVVGWLNAYWQEQLDEPASPQDIIHDKHRREEIFNGHVHNLPISFLALAAPTDLIEAEISHYTKAIGVVSLVRYHTNGEIDPSIWLTNLYVDKLYRNQNVGKLLIEYALAHVRKLKLDDSAASFNNTLKLFCHGQQRYYEKLGWQKTMSKKIAGKTGTEMIFKY